MQQVWIEVYSLIVAFYVSSYDWVLSPLNYSGSCDASPEAQCFNAFSSDLSSSSDDSCEDYIKNHDAISYILLSVFGGIIIGVFAAVVFIYACSNNSTPLGEEKKVSSEATFGPMSGNNL